MIHLVAIKAENFLSFRQFSLDLHKDGLYLISGWNQRGLDSNGSGKSSILEAICFALFGKTSTGLGPDAVRNWAVKEGMVVQLDLESGETRYRIVRKDKQVQFYENEQSTGATHKRDIQTVINDTFKTNYELFTSATFFANTKPFLAAQTDKDKKELFKPIFQLGRLDKAYDKVREMSDLIHTNMDNLNGLSSKKTSAMEENKDVIVDLSKKILEWDKTIAKTAEQLKASMLSLFTGTNTDLSTRVAELADKGAMILEDIEACRPLVEAWREELHSRRVASSVDAHRRDEIERVLGDSQLLKTHEICSSCGQVVTKDTLDRHIQELVNEQDTLSREIIEHTTRCIELDQLLLSHAEKEERLSTLKASYLSAKADLAMQLQVAESNITRKKDIELQLSKLYGSPCPYEETIGKLKEKVQIAEKEILEMDVQIKALSTKYDALAFLKWVFSKEGVSSYIMERAYGRLESLANRYLSLISSEGFQIEIKPQRELKSKALKEEIDIVITTQGKRIPYWGLSGGQRQRVNIALLISTYRLCRDLGINNFDFLLLDEVLDLSLADKGQSDTIKLLRRLLSEEIGQVFVISHKPDVSSEFDFVVEVVRDKDGVSKIA